MIYLKLHLLLALYACAAVCSKLAAQQEWLSLPFLLCYVGAIAILFVYALGWQWVLKRLPLGAAFANKAVVILWAIFLGYMLFNEPVSWRILVGASFIIAGIILMSKPATSTDVRP